MSRRFLSPFLSPSSSSSSSTALSATARIAPVYAVYFFTGIFTTIFGPSIKLLIADYRIDTIRAGLFISFVSLGRMIAALLSGVAADSVGRKPVLLTGVVLIASGLTGIGLTASYPVALGCCLLCGMGHGMTNTSASGLMADYYPDRLGRVMNLLNMVFGLGCLAGPLFSGFVLGQSTQWRVLFLIQGTMGTALVLWIAALKYRTAAAAAKNESGKTPWSAVLRTGGLTLLLLGGVMFIYTGSGHTINTWISKYLQEIVDLPIWLAAWVFAVYNLGLTAGRLVCGLIVEKIGYERVILFSALGALLSVTMALSVRNGTAAALALGLTGFFFGSLFPTATAIAGKMFPRNVATVSGILVVAAALGSMVLPAAAGAMAQWLDMEKALWFLSPLMGVLVLIALVLNRRRKRVNTADQNQC